LGIGIVRSQSIGYWVLGAELGIVLTLVSRPESQSNIAVSPGPTVGHLICATTRLTVGRVLCRTTRLTVTVRFLLTVTSRSESRTSGYGNYTFDSHLYTYSIVSFCSALKVDSSESNKAGLKCPFVRPYVRLSTTSFFDFNEISYVGRGRRVMQYDPIQGQGHEPIKVGNSVIFKGYLFPHL